MSNRVKIYVDGSCRNNGSPEAIGGIGIIIEEAFEQSSISTLVEATTNNQAEYLAVRMAVEKAVEYKLKDIVIYSDSKLIVNQIKGFWRVNDLKLQELRDEVVSRLDYFDSFEIEWIPRAENKANDIAQNITEKEK